MSSFFGNPTKDFFTCKPNFESCAVVLLDARCMVSGAQTWKHYEPNDKNAATRKALTEPLTTMRIICTLLQCVYQSGMGLKNPPNDTPLTKEIPSPFFTDDGFTRPRVDFYVEAIRSEDGVIRFWRLFFPINDSNFSFDIALVNLFMIARFEKRNNHQRANPKTKAPVDYYTNKEEWINDAIAMYNDKYWCGLDANVASDLPLDDTNNPVNVLKVFTFARSVEMLKTYRPRLPQKYFDPYLQVRENVVVQQLLGMIPSLNIDPPAESEPTPAPIPASGFAQTPNQAEDEEEDDVFNVIIPVRGTPPPLIESQPPPEPCSRESTPSMPGLAVPQQPRPRIAGIDGGENIDDDADWGEAEYQIATEETSSQAGTAALASASHASGSAAAGIPGGKRMYLCTFPDIAQEVPFQLRLPKTVFESACYQWPKSLVFATNAEELHRYKTNQRKRQLLGNKSKAIDTGVEYFLNLKTQCDKACILQPNETEWDRKTRARQAYLEKLKSPQGIDMLQSVMSCDEDNPATGVVNEFIRQQRAQNPSWSAVRPVERLLDSTLSVFGNFMAYEMLQLENTMLVSAIHEEILFVQITSLLQFDISCQLRMHVLFSGLPASGKSFVQDTLAKLMIPGTIERVSISTKNATTTVDVKSGLQMHVDELNSQFTDKGDGSGVAATKEMMVRGELYTEMCIVDPETRERINVRTISKRHCQYICGTNLGFYMLQEAIRSRFCCITVPSRFREKFDVTAETYQANVDPIKMHNLNEYRQRCYIRQMVSAVLHVLFRLDPDLNIDTAIVGKLLPSVAAHLRDIGILLGIRDRERLFLQCKAVCLIDAINRVFFTKYHFKPGVPFRLGQVFDCFEYLTVTREHFYFAFSQIFPSLYSPYIQPVMQALYTIVTSETSMESRFPKSGPGIMAERDLNRYVFQVNSAIGASLSMFDVAAELIESQLRSSDNDELLLSKANVHDILDWMRLQRVTTPTYKDESDLVPVEQRYNAAETKRVHVMKEKRGGGGYYGFTLSRHFLLEKMEQSYQTVLEGCIRAGMSVNDPMYGKRIVLGSSFRAVDLEKSKILRCMTVKPKEGTTFLQVRNDDYQTFEQAFLLNERAKSDAPFTTYAYAFTQAEGVQPPKPTASWEEEDENEDDGTDIPYGFNAAQREVVRAAMCLENRYYTRVRKALVYRLILVLVHCTPENRIALSRTIELLSTVPANMTFTDQWRNFVSSSTHVAYLESPKEHEEFLLKYKYPTEERLDELMAAWNNYFFEEFVDKSVPSEEEVFDMNLQCNTIVQEVPRTCSDEGLDKKIHQNWFHRVGCVPHKQREIFSEVKHMCNNGAYPEDFAYATEKNYAKLLARVLGDDGGPMGIPKPTTRVPGPSKSKKKKSSTTKNDEQMCEMPQDYIIPY